MKRIMIIAAAVLMACCAASAQDGRSIYNKYSGETGVEAVYISPSMFKMIGELPELTVDLDGDQVDMTPIVKSLNGMYILNSGNPEVNTYLAADVLGFAETGKFELLMEAKEEGETIKMYTSSSRRNDDFIDGFLLLVSEPEECTFIYLDGSMSRSDFEALVSAAMQ